MSDLGDDERPRKCRKIEDNKDEILRAILPEEIDLEIGLRARLIETVESRLAWGLALQDVLEKQVLGSEGHRAHDGPNQFADLAIATYKAANTSSELFFPSNLVMDMGITENQTLSTKASEPQRSPLQESHRPRHVTRPHVQLHHEDRIVKEPNRYLYLRDTTSTPIMIYKIACPDCRRSDFPRLQGLLNHCRLKHHREFASHDECVQACSSVVPEDEQPFVVEHGLEVTGMSASLQRLFRMAVGSYEGIVAVPVVGDVADLTGLVRQDESEEELKEPVFVTKTLGHHKDTPALAPFLGRAPKKRQIHVYDEDKTTDIISVDDTVASLREWRKCRGANRLAEGRADEVLFDDKNESSMDGAVAAKGLLTAYEGSRFHIPLRLIVNDYSLRLPEEFEGAPGPTHKWMVSVTTASYSLHISTVLSKISVVCASDPPHSNQRDSLSVSEPPFAVMGTSREPFLAQITLEWVGSRNKPTQIEHWVELRDGKSTRPVKGDEQVLDVELDRHTEILPRKHDSWKIDWSSQGGELAKTADESQNMAQAPECIDPDWMVRLRKIARNFPLTAQDSGPRNSSQVPYFLPLTVEHFLSLVEGRRKAIEWARARAIWETFASSVPDIDNKMREASDYLIKLTGPVDVHRWLKREGLCIDTACQSSPSRKPLQEQYCSVCGHRASTHRKGKVLRGRDGEEQGTGRVCEPSSFAGRMPIVEIQEFLGNHVQSVRRRCATKALIGDAPARLLGKVDPSLLIGVQRIVSVLRLPSFPIPGAPISSGSTPTKESRERELVPYAVLTVSLRALIRFLVWIGLQSMELKSESSTKPNITGLSGSHVTKKRLLTPAHVVRGLAEGARKKTQRDLHRALLLAMSRLGVGVDDAKPQKDQPDVLGVSIHGSDHDERLHPEIN